MSHRTKVSLICDWPGCERGHKDIAADLNGALSEGRRQGWHRALGMDFCPIHPRHEAEYANTGALSCLSCGWSDDSEGHPGGCCVGPRWLAHLTPIERGYDGTEHVARNLQLAQESSG